MQAILAVATAGVLTCPPKALIACNATIVFGVYGRSCEEVEAFTSACIGCAAGHSPIVHSVAIVDDARNGTAVGRYTGWRCGGITHTFISSQGLPSRAAGEIVPVTERRYFPRTQALFRKMLSTSPHARWLIKMDTDSFFNAVRWGRMQTLPRLCLPHIASLTASPHVHVPRSRASPMCLLRPTTFIPPSLPCNSHAPSLVPRADPQRSAPDRSTC